jgi:hypothetical protein
MPEEHTMADKKVDGDTAVREKIAELPAYRDVAARLHELILEAAPDLTPRLWYGMPGYAKAKSSPVICFFRVDDDQYVTLGLTEKANHTPDADAPDRLLPSAWFLTGLDDATEARIAAIVAKAAG